MNQYEKALESYQMIPVESKYYTKALANQASVCCQAREFDKAFELLD